MAVTGTDGLKIVGQEPVTQGNSGETEKERDEAADVA